MSGFLWRVAMRLTRSPILTVSARRWALGRLGIDLPFLGKISAGTHIGGPNVKIGQYFQSNVDCHFDDWVTFGDMVAVGPRVSIITTTHPIGKADHRRGWGEIVCPVDIGDGSWLQTGCIIQCVDIAPGCIIAPGAIVTKPTEPNGFYAGIPARRIRDLPTDREEFLKCLV